nr:DUF4468 domain-containing protein [uncultured Marinifilum sp.]
MKRNIFLLFFLLSIILNGNSQNYNLPLDSTGNVVFREVVNCNISKNTLYPNAQEWIAKTFGDYKKVIQFEDEANGKLILKGTCDVKHFVEAHIAGMHIINRESIQFTLTIECKENKYRYTMDNIVVILKNDGQNFESSIFKRINNVKSSQDRIESLSQELVNFKKLDTSSLKRKQLKEHQNNITKIEQRIKSMLSGINSNTDFINSELEAINSIIPSLKNAMSKIDNF